MRPPWVNNPCARHEPCVGWSVWTGWRRGGVGNGDDAMRCKAGFDASKARVNRHGRDSLAARLPTRVQAIAAAFKVRTATQGQLGSVGRPCGLTRVGELGVGRRVVVRGPLQREDAVLGTMISTIPASHARRHECQSHRQAATMEIKDTLRTRDVAHRHYQHATMPATCTPPTEGPPRL